MFWRKINELKARIEFLEKDNDSLREEFIKLLTKETIRERVNMGTISIPLNIDGVDPVDKTREYLANAPLLLMNEMFAQEIKEYIGEQFAMLGLEAEESKLANIVRGKIFGASEIYARIKTYDLQSREGIEQNNEPNADEESEGRA